MAIYRNVSMSFWTDNKVTDDFTPEDRYFYLYLFTNPHTNLCGCYEISVKHMSYETGYSKESIENLIDRFEKVHKVLRFSRENKEVLLLNWSKHNWTSSEKFRKPLAKEIECVKTVEFKEFLLKVFNGEDTVSIPYGYGIDTTCIDTTVTITDTVTVSNSINSECKEIIDHLNQVLGTHYKYTTKKTRDSISARLNEDFTVDDFKAVIDKKHKEWSGTDMEKYLRPETLFGNKFEGYLNQKATNKKEDNENEEYYGAKLF